MTAVQPYMLAMPLLVHLTSLRHYISRKYLISYISIYLRTVFYYGNPFFLNEIVFTFDCKEIAGNSQRSAEN